ncbi:alpha/beta hydrolase [Desulfuromonas versatilis]|uniref:Alpha/beta hydrolase n=1 Tax=Desulfuromonas versatilis TaxID=2802975 RepID=A0ABN6DXQ8_9BACT|nr:alpha/beta fold hydrolase [Desulfuromonas versatilis]BCR04314.1 alpha/beta hydrolase [Desulfuromonas versatilis]
MATAEQVSIPVTGRESISGVLHRPAAAGRGARLRPTVIIAHGAGGDMNHEFIVAMAEGLAAAGFAALRFNFLYCEQGKKTPDNPGRLAAAWRAAFEFIRDHDKLGAGEIVVSGKSMGGRIGSQLVADGLLPADRLILFGYPLHPAGKPDQLRDAHLYRIKTPTLFIQGTRDSMCKLEKLEGVVKKMPKRPRLEIIDGGDHSFKVPKAQGRSPREVFAEILQRTADWLGG